FLILYSFFYFIFIVQKKTAQQQTTKKNNYCDGGAGVSWCGVAETAPAGTAAAPAPTLAA
ncbi:unnamed protein product, partial [Rotaria magnacalcarata]